MVTSPLTMGAVLEDRTHIGFSGSRVPDLATSNQLSRMGLHVRSLKQQPVLWVGDADGVDKLIRASLLGYSHATVYERDTSIVPIHRSLIARSTALAIDLSQHAAPLLVAGPSKACPFSIRPTGVWIAGKTEDNQGDVSGTWSTVGVAVGVGVPCLLYLPPGRISPPGAGRGWDWQVVWNGWWYHEGIKASR